MAAEPVPVTPTIASGGPAASEKMIQQLREYAKALMTKQKSPTPVYTWANGLNDAMGDVLGAYNMRHANQLEQNANLGKSKSDADLWGSPDASGAPATIPHYAPATDSAGGAGAAAPFSASPPTPSKVSSIAPSLGPEGTPGLPPPTPPGLGPSTKVASLGGYTPTQADIMAAEGIESGHNPNAITGRNYGSMQFSPDQRQHFHITNWRDPQQNRAAYVQEARENTPALSRALGHDPTGSDIYGAHQQGLAGYSALSTHQDTPAWRAVRQFYPSDKVAHSAIEGNLYGPTKAYAMAHPDEFLSRDMIGYWRNLYDSRVAKAGGGGSSPVGTDAPATKLAADTSPAPGYAPSQVQKDMSKWIWQRGFTGGDPLSPDQITTMNNAVNAARPQFEVNPYGQVIRKAPGEEPRFTGTMPGHPGAVGPFGKGPLQQQMFMGPDGRLHQRLILPEVSVGGGTSAPAPAATPPAATPSPATPAPTPPSGGTGVAGGTALPPPPPKFDASAAPAGGTSSGGMLTASAPAKEPEMPSEPWKVAGEILAPSKPAKAATDDLVEDAARGVDWRSYVDRANAMPPVEGAYHPPNELDLLERAGRGDRDALNKIMNLDDLKENAKKKGEVQDQETAKEMGETSKALAEAHHQSLKLRDSLKEVNHVIKMPGFESGSFAAPITEVRRWVGELKTMSERYKDADGNFPFKGIFDKLDADKASPNEVFVKVVSGSILQSLRGMLGPNSGQFRVQELKMLEQAWGNPNMSLEGNKIVMDMVDRLNDRSIVFGRMANDYKKTHGALDANFIDTLDKYAADHPVITPNQYNELLGMTKEGKPLEKPKGAEGPSRSDRAYEELKRRFPDRYK